MTLSTLLLICPINIFNYLFEQYMPNYTNYATKGLIFEKNGTEGKDKVLIFWYCVIISFSMVEKSQRTNPHGKPRGSIVIFQQNCTLTAYGLQRICWCVLLPKSPLDPIFHKKNRGTPPPSRASRRFATLAGWPSPIKIPGYGPGRFNMQAEYQFTLEHLARKANDVPDFLSRYVHKKRECN